MSIFKTNLTLLNRFLNNFMSCFSKKQMEIFTFLIYAMFKDYKRVSLQSIARASNIDYQRLQYFLSESQWDVEAINNKRLSILKNQRTTSSTEQGFLTIDDSSCPKPYAKNTQGAKYQYCAPLKGYEVCNVAVATAYVSKSKHFPVQIELYMPASEFDKGKKDSQFRNKIDIAIELFDKALESIKFKAAVFDSWYSTKRLLLHIENKNKTFFSEIKANRNIYTYHPGEKRWRFVKVGELVTLIKKHYKNQIKTRNVF